MERPKTEKERVVTIDDVEYKFDDLNEEQQIRVNHVADLENKLNGIKWNWDQIAGGRDFFMAKLQESIEKNKTEGKKVVEAEVQQ